MSRTYRWNLERARGAGPELCEVCNELVPKHVLTTYPAWGAEIRRLVCDDCLDELVVGLLRHGVEYRVGGYDV